MIGNSSIDGENSCELAKQLKAFSVSIQSYRFIHRLTRKNVKQDSSGPLTRVGAISDTIVR